MSSVTHLTNQSQFVQANAAFNGTNISGTIASNGLSLSVNPGGGAGDGYNILAAGTQTANTTGTVAFVNGNGITFGMSNSSQITASYNSTQFLTTARASNDAIGLNTAKTNVTWTVNSSGLSLDASGYAGTGFASTTTNGSVVAGTHATNGMTLAVPAFLTTAQPVGAYLTTARASNDAIGLNTAKTNVTWTVNSSGLSLDASGYAGTGVTTASTAGSDFAITHGTNGLSMGVPKYLTTAMQSNAATISNVNVSAGTTSTNASAFTFSNGNGVSFGLGTGVNAGVVTATVATNYQSQGAYLTTARASNDGIGLNTAATNVTWTVNSSGISLNASGYAGVGTTFNGTNVSASMTLNSNGLRLDASVAAPGGGGGAAISAGVNSQNTGTVNFANSNGITFGLSNNGTMTASHNGLTTARASNDAVGLNTAATNVTWTVNSSGISLNGAGYAGTGTSATNASITLNSNGLAISVAAPGGGVAQTRASTVIPGEEDYFLNKQITSTSMGQNSVYVYGAYIPDAMTGSIVRIPFGITNSSSAVSSGRKGQTINLGIYTTNATNSTVLSLWQSTSYTIAASISSNASLALSLITGIGNTTSYNTLTASSAGLNLSASLHGNRDIIMPLTASFSSGSYWFAFHNSTSGAGTVGNVLNMSQVVHTWATFNPIGLSTNATGSGILKGFGIGTYSATSAALPNGISLTQINQLGIAPTFYIGNETI